MNLILGKMIMKKILFLLGTSLTVCAPAFADHDEDDFSEWGFYAGLSAIHQSIDMDYSLSPDYSALVPPIYGNNQPSSITFGDSGYGGEAMLGYFMRFGEEDEDEYDWQVALEIAFDAAGNSMEYTYAGPLFVPQLDSETHLEYSYGVRLLPGYFVSPRTLLFVDLGLTWGHFETTFLETFGPDFGTYNESTDNLFGFRYGLGMEHFFTDEFSLGLEYAITSYENYHVTSTGFEENVGIVPVDNKYQPTVSTGSLEFKYYFY